MTHNKKFLEKDVATNLLWSMIPETKAFCPRGLGIIPYELPSSVKLADATIEALNDYDVAMWEKHGVFAVHILHFYLGKLKATVISFICS